MICFQVKRFDIHFQRETEVISSRLNLSFVHMNASVHHGLVLHLRRTDSIFSWSESNPSRELIVLARKWEKTYLRRLMADRTGICKALLSTLLLNSVDGRDWTNVGFQLTNSIEQCRQEQHNKRMECCYSLSKCERILLDEQFSILTWHRANDSWSVVA